LDKAIRWAIPVELLGNFLEFCIELVQFVDYHIAPRMALFWCGVVGSLESLTNEEMP